MRTIDPVTHDQLSFNRYLTGVVAPRPIAFVSTVDAAGNVNLSPFSFFNVFSYNPPVLIFSVSTRMRNLPPKNTLENVREVPEAVINIVRYDMVEQMSLASAEYEKGVNEFVKAGFTEVPSSRVRPPRVKESPAAFECTVRQILPLAENGGAGNLVICDVVLAHFAEELFDENDNIDPVRLDAVARMGNNWYARADREAIFEIIKPGRHTGIGVDQLPEAVRNSKVLTGNNLGRLGTLENLPDPAFLQQIRQHKVVTALIDSQASREEWHQAARDMVENGETMEAMGVLMWSLEAEGEVMRR